MCVRDVIWFFIIVMAYYWGYFFNHYHDNAIKYHVTLSNLQDNT